MIYFHEKTRNRGSINMKCQALFTSLILLTSSICSQTPNSILATENSSKRLVVNNRILAKVNEKTISVLDVVKKMDVFLNKYYPHLIDSPVARYQYFNANWKETLSQMIDNELILADAQKLELKITDAEIRETIIERFGPNIMASLDKLKLSYEEAKEMIQTEITVDKMTWYRVHSKALQAVGPEEIKKAYQNYVVKNPPSEKLEYQVLSIRTKDEALGKTLSDRAFSLLNKTKKALPDVICELKEEYSDDSSVTISLSEEYQTDTKSISENHKHALLKLAVDSISEPLRQMSKVDQTAVYRIFHLKNRKKVLPPVFSQISDKLKDELLQQEVMKASSSYLQKLREKFGYDSKNLEDNSLNDFHPFELE